MATSRTLAAAGVRSATPRGSRSDAATIAGTVRAHPNLILVGIIGFALRGGLILLTVPVVILPTQVEVRDALGGNLGSTGLTPGFFALVAAVTLVALGFALLVLYILARCELAAFSRFVNSPALSDAHAWSPPGSLEADARGTATTRLFVAEALTLLAILIAAVPLAVAISNSTLDEILLPSSADSIYARVFGDVTTPFIGWLIAIVVIEGISAVAVRRILARPFGLSGHMQTRRHVLRLIGVCVFGWILFICGLLVGIGALSLAWIAVRDVFLSTGLSGGVLDIASALLVALMFGAVFTAALTLSGVVSIVRAGLWTLASLR